MAASEDDVTPGHSSWVQVEAAQLAGEEWSVLLRARKLNVEESTRLRQLGVRKDPRAEPAGPTVVRLLEEDDGTVLPFLCALIVRPVLQAYKEALGAAVDEPTLPQLEQATEQLLERFHVRAVRLALCTAIDKEMPAAPHARRLLEESELLALQPQPPEEDENAADCVGGAQETPEILVEQARRVHGQAVAASNAVSRDVAAGRPGDTDDLKTLQRQRAVFDRAYQALIEEAEQLSTQPPAGELSAMEAQLAHHRQLRETAAREQRRQDLGPVTRLQASDEASDQTREALQQLDDTVQRIIDGHADDAERAMVEAVTAICAAESDARPTAITARQAQLGTVGATVALGLLTAQVLVGAGQRGEPVSEVADTAVHGGHQGEQAAPGRDVPTEGEASSADTHQPGRLPAGQAKRLLHPSAGGQETTPDDTPPADAAPSRAKPHEPPATQADNSGQPMQEAGEPAGSATAPSAYKRESGEPTEASAKRAPAAEPLGEAATSPAARESGLGSEGREDVAELDRAEPAYDAAPPQKEVELTQPEEAADHEGPAEHEEEDLAAAERHLAELVDGGHLALASWAAPAAGQTRGEQAAMAAAALIEAATVPDGRLCRAFAEHTSALSLDELHDAAGLQRLALVSAMRAQLLGLWTTNAPMVLGGLRRAFEGCPATLQLLDALHHAEVVGAYLAPELMPTAKEQAECEQEHEELVQTALGQSDSAVKRSLSFQRATRIWQSWLRPAGELREALERAATDARDDVEKVEQVCTRFSTDSVDDRIEEADALFRGPGNRAVEGSARLTLQRYVREIVELLEAWTVSVRQLAREHGEVDHNRQRALGSLRETFRECLDAVEAELHCADGDNLDVAASVQAVRSLHRSDAILSGEEFLTGREPSADEVLGRDLLRTSGVRLDGLRADGEPSSVAPFVAAVSTSWKQAFHNRSEEGDHQATQHIVRILQYSDDPAQRDLAGELHQQREEEVDAERQAVCRLVENRQRRFDQLRPILLDGQQDVLLAAQLEELDPEPPDQNYAHVRQRIDDYDRALAAAVDDITEQLQYRRQTLEPIGQAAQGQIDRMLADGDLVSAEELIAAVERGETITSSNDVVDATPELERAAQARATAPLNRDLVDQLAEHHAADGLDLTALAPAERERAVEGLSAWLQLRGRRARANLTDHLPQLLRLLGLGPTPGHLEVRTQPGRRDAEYAVVAADHCHPRDPAPVPVWGSRRRGRYVLLALWERCSVSSLVEHARQAAGDEPLMALFPGAMSDDERIELGRVQRYDEGLELIVVDDVVVSAVAAEGGGSWERTLRLTLPFSSANPYVPYVTGNVPAEMFFGRSRELQAVIDPDGSSFIFGGRQLGKSALLKRAAELHHSNEPPRAAVYLDLLASEIGAYLPTGELWNRLAEELRDVGVQVTDRNFQNNPRVLEQAITAWLDEDPQRRLLILLDECDRFLEADRDADFATTRRLKGLMDQSGRRVKVVFAGLHQVLRFQRLTNQPFAHLGPQTPIGPLAARDARQLLVRPLSALGYKFDPPELAHRVLSFTNYAPSLIQLVGHWLVRTAQTHGTIAELPPHRITADVIDAVLSDPELIREMRARFEWTVRLDPRYEAVAYYLAVRAYDLGPSESITVKDLVDEVRQWRPDDFTFMLEDEDEQLGLLEEMVQLGVLALDATARSVRLRSPNILRLIGDEERARQALQEAAKRPRHQSFDRERARRRLGDGDHRRSPLSEQQLSDLLSAQRDLRVVVGSSALHVERVPLILQRAAEGLDHVVVSEAEASVKPLRSRIKEPRRVQPTLLVVPATDLDPREFAELLGLVSRDLAGLRRAETRTEEQATKPQVRVCFTIGPQQVPALQAADIPAQLPQPIRIRVRRWGVRAMRMWRHEEDRHDIPDDLLEETLRDTGGWPTLLERAQELVQHEATDWRTALDAVREQLRDASFCQSFLRATGLTEQQPLLTLARQLRTWQETGVVSIGDVDALVEPADLGGLDPRGCLETLELLSIVDLDRVQEDALEIPLERQTVKLETTVADALAVIDASNG